MAHVKAHYRVVHGKTVYVHDHDNAKPQGTEAALHERTAVGIHKGGTHYLRATDAEDGKHIQAAADKLGIQVSKRRAGAFHHGRQGAYDHFHVSDPAHAAALHEELKKHGNASAGGNPPKSESKPAPAQKPLPKEDFFDHSVKSKAKSDIAHGATYEAKQKGTAEAHQEAWEAHNAAKMAHKEAAENAPDKATAQKHFDAAWGHADKMNDHWQAKEHASKVDAAKKDPVQAAQMATDAIPHDHDSASKPLTLEQLKQTHAAHKAAAGAHMTASDHPGADRGHHSKMADTHTQDASQIEGMIKEHEDKQKQPQPQRPTVQKKAYDEGEMEADAMAASDHARDAGHGHQVISTKAEDETHHAHAKGTPEAHLGAAQAHKKAATYHQTAATYQNANHEAHYKAQDTHLGLAAMHESKAKELQAQPPKDKATLASEKAHKMTSDLGDGGTAEQHRAAAEAHTDAMEFAQSAGRNGDATTHKSYSSTHARKAQELQKAGATPAEAPVPYGFEGFPKNKTQILSKSKHLHDLATHATPEGVSNTKAASATTKAHAASLLAGTGTAKAHKEAGDAHMAAAAAHQEAARSEANPVKKAKHTALGKMHEDVGGHHGELHLKAAKKEGGSGKAEGASQAPKTASKAHPASTKAIEHLDKATPKSSGNMYLKSGDTYSGTTHDYSKLAHAASEHAASEGKREAHAAAADFHNVAAKRHEDARFDSHDNYVKDQAEHATIANHHRVASAYHRNMALHGKPELTEKDEDGPALPHYNEKLADTHTATILKNHKGGQK